MMLEITDVKQKIDVELILRPKLLMYSVSTVSCFFTYWATKATTEVYTVICLRKSTISTVCSMIGLRNDTEQNRSGLIFQTEAAYCKVNLDQSYEYRFWKLF